MDSILRIPADFGTLKAHYIKWWAEPAWLKNYMKTLPHGSTSCCIQLSNALNATSTTAIPQVVTPGRRYGDNPAIDGGNGYYLLCVDEVETFLTKRFGNTTCFNSSDAANSADQVKLGILGRQGILLFRDGIYPDKAGMHVELWDGSQILQHGNTAAGMNEKKIFSQPRILFWEVAPNNDSSPLPDWLQGWWEVYDGNYYYYYFSDKPAAFYTKTKPTSGSMPPTSANPKNYATVKMQAYGPILTWTSVSPDGPTEEAFTRLGWTSETEMNGTSSAYGQLYATKL